MVDVGACGVEIGEGWIGILSMVMILKGIERGVTVLRSPAGGEVVRVLRVWISRGETEGRHTLLLRLQILCLLLVLLVPDDRKIHYSVLQLRV